MKAPLKRRAAPDRRFGSLHVDIVGPLPESKGQKYLLTVIDRYTRWVEAIPMADISAETCVKSLLHGWIARFGVPGDVVADRGAQFTSSLWRRLHEQFGIQCNNTTAYHPQANGMIERVHRQLKAALMARQDQTDWMTHLPLVLLGIRTSWRAEMGCSPAELTYGTTLHLPGECVASSNAEFIDHDLLRKLHDQM